MKTTYVLTEKEITEAIAAYVAHKKNTEGKASVQLRCDKDYDRMGRETGIVRVSATVTVEDGQ